MPASVRVLLLSGHSCSRALLRLLSSGGLLSGGGFGSRTLLRLLASGSFSRRTLLSSEIRGR